MEKHRCRRCLDCLCLLVLYPLVAFPFEKLVNSTKSWVTQRWELGRLPCTDAEGLAAESNSSTGLKVILPSTGQTGTTSVHWALCRMGLRSYHAEERTVFTYPVMWDTDDPNALVASVSRCRPDVLVLEPTTDNFPVIMQHSPGAKVIITWRDHTSWFKSISSPWMQDIMAEWLRTFTGNSMRLFGWMDLWDLLTGRITKLMDRGDPFSCGLDIGFEEYAFLPFYNKYFHPLNNVFWRGSYKLWGQEEGYLAHINEIRTLTPPGDLLAFDVRKDSWDKLEGFLGLSAGEHAKEPFPRPRQANAWTNNILWLHYPVTFVITHLTFLAFTCINFAILLPLLRLLRHCLCRLCCLPCAMCGAARKQD